MAKHEFLWFDLETTGLLGTAVGDLQNGGTVLEFAVVLVADDRGGDMSIVEEFTAPIKPPAGYTIGDYCQRMHTANGLLKDCEQSGLSSYDADSLLVEICQMLAGPDPKGIVLAGNSVHFDLQWVRACLPRFAACLSHRVFDISTLIRLAQSWGSHPENWTRAEPAHRALDDIRQSVATAKKFREEIGLLP